MPGTLKDLIDAGHAIRQAQDQAQQASKDMAAQIAAARQPAAAPQQPAEQQPAT